MVSPAPPQPEPRDGTDAAGPARRRWPLSPRAALLLLGINVLWGGSSLAAKIALTCIPPMTLAFARFSLAAVLLYALANLLRVDLRVARRDWGMFWAMGGLGLALTYLLYYAGVRQTTAAEAALLTAAEPVFVAVLSVLLLRERLPTPKIVGIAFGLCGVALIVGRGVGLPPRGGMGAGDLLITLGLIAEALAILVGKGVASRYPAITVSTYQMLTGAVILAPFAITEMGRTGWRPAWDASSVPAYLCVLYLVLFCTVLAYTVWFLLLDRHSASDLSMFLFVQPVVGALLGVVFRHDPLTGATLVGAASVLLGIALLHRLPPQPVTQTPP